MHTTFLMPKQLQLILFLYFSKILIRHWPNYKLTEGKRRAGIGWAEVGGASVGGACWGMRTGEQLTVSFEALGASCKPEGLRYPSVSQSAGETQRQTVHRYPCGSLHSFIKNSRFTIQSVLSASDLVPLYVCFTQKYIMLRK